MKNVHRRLEQIIIIMYILCKTERERDKRVEIEHSFQVFFHSLEWESEVRKWWRDRGEKKTFLGWKGKMMMMIITCCTRHEVTCFRREQIHVLSTQVSIKKDFLSLSLLTWYLLSSLSILDARHQKNVVSSWLLALSRKAVGGQEAWGELELTSTVGYKIYIILKNKY